MSDIIEVQGRYYIRANASIADTGTRILKHADTFGVFDRHGDIRPLGFENQGIFHEGTRYLSRWKLGINGASPLLLSSTVREENDFLVVDLTNPALPPADGKVIPHGTLHLTRTLFLWNGDLFERTDVSNFGMDPVSLILEFRFQSDYADLFELRGNVRHRHGHQRPPQVGSHGVLFCYEGLDSVVRHTRFHFSVPPTELSKGKAVFHMDLKAREEKSIESRVSCSDGKPDAGEMNFATAYQRVHSVYEDYRKNVPEIETSNPLFNDWIHQSRADLHLLLTRTSGGLYPYAGIPWFSCVFGRDGIITALETLWVHPEIARGVLTHLAARQAGEIIPEKDAEPGKILHEERKGEMVALGEVPFGLYYGSIDATPLWLVLAGAFWERTGDKDLMAHLWPNIQRALAWIDTYGDCDGDGFVEYRRRATGGLSNQGWKDADDSIFHSDGSIAQAPIALCEVQGYVYLAKLRAAQIAEALGFGEEAGKLREAAARLKTAFHEKFWCDDIQSYAIALDGEKSPCRIRSSNAGQCLFTGIAQSEAAAHIKEHLIGKTFFSGWGVRTIPTTEARYNPMSYHNGSIWPHDNALIADGLSRYGFKDAALKILCALFGASRFMESNRLPELYCGFPRRRGEGPTLYPVACNPKAWSSASVFLLLQACLGLRIEVARERLYFDNPCLPESIREMEIRNLAVGTGLVDVLLSRHEQGVTVNVRRRTGKIEVIVIH